MLLFERGCRGFCVSLEKLKIPSKVTHVKFVFSKKATKIDEIFTVDLKVCSKCQIDGEDFCGLLRKHEL